MVKIDLTAYNKIGIIHGFTTKARLVAQKIHLERRELLYINLIDSIDSMAGRPVSIDSDGDLKSTLFLESIAKGLIYSLYCTEEFINYFTIFDVLAEALKKGITDRDITLFADLYTDIETNLPGTLRRIYDIVLFIIDKPAGATTRFKQEAVRMMLKTWKVNYIQIGDGEECSVKISEDKWIHFNEKGLIKQKTT